MYSTKAFDSLLLLISSIKYISALATMPVAFSDSNYVVTTLPVTWSEAYVLCQQNGMNLVSIKSAEEQDALAKALSFYGSPDLTYRQFPLSILCRIIPYMGDYETRKKSIKRPYITGNLIDQIFYTGNFEKNLLL
uniref:C-type lectin domain-containing protein n=1 Tax=Dendroctonus ponderosae TaxID=77166 RepID=A0AAR5PJW7_DENPD